MKNWTSLNNDDTPETFHIIDKNYVTLLEIHFIFYIKIITYKTIQMNALYKSLSPLWTEFMYKLHEKNLRFEGHRNPSIHQSYIVVFSYFEILQSTRILN